MNRLLYVEDDIITGSVYRRHFQAAGYQVELADNGEQALAALMRSEPDIVVLDLLIPKVNGLDILKHIRSQPATKSLPVIVFTNVYASDMISQEEQAGADKWLHKAKTDLKTLILAIGSALDDARQKSGAEQSLAASTLEQPGNTSANAGQDPRAALMEAAPSALAELRRLAAELLKEERDPVRYTLLVECSNNVRRLTGLAGLAHVELFAQVASAVELLFNTLCEKPNSVNSSTLRTGNQSVQLLNAIFPHAFSDVDNHFRPFKILVVDDDPISLKLVCAALKKGGLNAQGQEDPVAALAAFQ